MGDSHIAECCPTCGALPRDQELGRLGGYELVIDQPVASVDAHVHEQDGRVRLLLKFDKSDEITLERFRLVLDERVAAHVLDRLTRAAEIRRGAA